MLNNLNANLTLLLSIIYTISAAPRCSLNIMAHSFVY